MDSIDAQLNVHGKMPFGDFQISRGERSLVTSAATRQCLALVGGRVGNQPFDGIGAIRFLLGLNPFGVGVAARSFTERAEVAFRRAFEEGFEELGSDLHA